MLEYCLRPEPAVCRIAAARRKQLSRAEADALSLFPVSSWSASEAFWSIHLHFVGASDQQLYSLHRHDGKMRDLDIYVARRLLFRPNAT